jgi:NAD(P)-dependent dehydrogenase (short-subunit alcohol dehydrogenase family)
MVGAIYYHESEWGVSMRLIRSIKSLIRVRSRSIEAEIRRSLFPTLWCCRAVLPVMLEGSGGVIVNVSSVATRGVNRVPYAAAKGGVNAITACLAFEYSEHGIRACGVAPGGTERRRGASRATPLRRLNGRRSGTSRS